MIISIKGGTSMGATSKNYLLYIQHHPSNCVTSDSFHQKSWIGKLIGVLCQEGKP